MLPIHTILHPTDFSASAENAFHLAAALARDYGARLLVLHVSPEPIMNFGQGIIPPDPVETERETRARLHDYVEKIAAGNAEEFYLVGDAAKVIVSFAEENGCDMIVMGTHGRSGLSRILMGSVAEEVLRRARIPVLVVRMPFPEAAPVEEARSAEEVSVQPVST